jgi:ribonuclease III
MLTAARKSQLKTLQKLLGIRFKRLSVLSLALTHRSFEAQSRLTASSPKDNQRLEFLGDAVLKLVLAEYLYLSFPGKNEGDLSKLLSMLISDAFLARTARGIHLDQYILFGENEQKNHIQELDSTLADAMESIIAACFIDLGLKAARKLILRFISPAVNHLDSMDFVKDYKTLLQEYTQSLSAGTPLYTLTGHKGPEHRKTFQIKVEVSLPQGSFCALGEGRSKKTAEQAAARKLAKELGI